MLFDYINFTLIFTFQLILLHNICNIFTNSDFIFSITFNDNDFLYV